MGHFELQCRRTFTRYPIFGVDVLSCMKKMYIVFLHSCNMGDGEEISYKSLNVYAYRDIYNTGSGGRDVHSV